MKLDRNVLGLMVGGDIMICGKSGEEVKEQPEVEARR